MRPEKINELQALLKSKIQKFMENFEAKYNVAIEELAAKDGTGKKYGRPKRLA